MNVRKNELPPDFRSWSDLAVYMVRYLGTYDLPPVIRLPYVDGRHLNEGEIPESVTYYDIEADALMTKARVERSLSSN